jgi:hypothetical protein
MPSQPSHTLSDPPLTLYEGQEERTPREWEGQYVNAWLLLQGTIEDEAGEPVRAKLVAITTDPMTDAFQQLWRSYFDEWAEAFCMKSQLTKSRWHYERPVNSSCAASDKNVDHRKMYGD